jgi:hypothetical protein
LDPLYIIGKRAINEETEFLLPNENEKTPATKFDKKRENKESLSA